MNTIKDKFLKRRIPVWIAIVAVFFIATGFFLYGNSTLNVKDDYTFTAKDPNGKTIELSYGSLPALSNPNFFASVKDNLIREKKDFVEANLSEMILRVYLNGEVIKEVPILTKGREGSWWETPAGLYKAEVKEEKHLSSFSPVYTPWNIHFQGNFFIHGWPYWAETGKDVESAYSGGCIRLSTIDAKEVYDLININTPVLVFENNKEFTDHAYSPNVYDISAEGFIAADIGNSYVFLEKNKEEQFDLGGMTNLLTALVATDYMDIERELIVPKEALVETSEPRLKVGNRYSVFDLLFPLLIESSNESAVALASPLGRIYFKSLLQKKAEAIGMSNTTIDNINGGSGENKTTLEDTFHLANYLYNNRKFILNLSRGVIDNNAYGEPVFTNIRKNTQFKDNKSYVGGIIGKTIVEGSTTESGLAIFNVNFNGEERPIIISVFNSENATLEIEKILEYIKTSFK